MIFANPENVNFESWKKFIWNLVLFELWLLFYWHFHWYWVHNHEMTFRAQGKIHFHFHYYVWIYHFDNFSHILPNSPSSVLAGSNISFSTNLQITQYISTLYSLLSIKVPKEIMSAKPSHRGSDTASQRCKESISLVFPNIPTTQVHHEWETEYFTLLKSHIRSSQNIKQIRLQMLFLKSIYIVYFLEGINIG